MDAAKECCGLYGVFGAPDAVELTYLGLYALQHRGQESAGIAVSDGTILDQYLGMGLVQDVFSPDVFARLKGDRAIGHVRYSTTGSCSLKNAQPLVVDCAVGRLAIAHNGNLVNSHTLKEEMLRQGHLFPVFSSTTDTEVMLYLIARGADLKKSIRTALRTVRGAYSLLLLAPQMMIAARDPHGFRPLSLGRLPGGGYVVASETCAFDLTKAEFIREIEPGEILYVTKSGLTSDRIVPQKEAEPSMCLFEYVYFARPDSRLAGDNVHEVRKRLGRRLAFEYPVEADIVVPLPDSGSSAALGYSEQSGIPLEYGFVRNHYVGRTFIQPTQNTRDSGVQIKLNIVKEVVAGKRVVVVDDSIIRGTTSRSRVQLLKQAGAREVHMRVSCPPTKFACFYGIDFPTKTQLIAANMSVPEIAKFIGVDSLGYLSLEGMRSCVTGKKGSYCTACWTGEYRVPITDDFKKLMFEPTCP